MKHVFIATQKGWDQKKDVIWFDADQYSQDEAESQFEEKEGQTEKANGLMYPYKYYEYDGVEYHDYYYKGLFEDDEMP